MNIKNILERLKSTGFFHICSSYVINNVIAFCSSIFITRLLSKADYGVYSAANNTVSLFMLLNGLGTVSAILQYGSESFKDLHKKNAYIKYGFKIGSLFSVVTTAAIVLYALFAPLALPETQPYLILLSLLPAVSYITNVLSTVLRVDLRNKAYSLYNTGSTALIFAATVTGALLFGVWGVILFRYVAYALAFAVVIFACKNVTSFFKEKNELTQQEKKAFMRISLASCANNGISEMLYLLDVFLIGVIIKDSSILASYKTATLIPTACGFIPTAVITYIYPYFAQHCKDIGWFRSKYKTVFTYMILINGLISLGLFFFAPLIVHIIFGSRYSDSVSIFRVLSIGFFFSSSFRVLSGNILVMLKKLRFNLFVAVASGLLNVVLDIWFIQLWGSMGAAIATVSIYVFSGACSTIYLNYYLKKGHLKDGV